MSQPPPPAGLSKHLVTRLAKLPAAPGVYFFKNSRGQIIYIGKAASLRNRVRQYFQAGRPADTKTMLLVRDITGLDWQQLETEADAIFLEAEMVRRYQPHYNILLRDDKASLYVRIDYKSDYPTVGLVRRPLDDGAEYFGPYVNPQAIRQALRFLRRAFPYATKRPIGKRRASLDYHLGLDPGLEEDPERLADYRANLRKLMRYLHGERSRLVKQIEGEMKSAAKSSQFERAARLRDQLKSLQALGRQNLLSQTEMAETNRDHALNQLAEILQLPQLPGRIKGFDISHLQGTDNTASMVVFTNGLPDKAQYRKFKMYTPGNDDFAHMYEAISRRLSERNVKKWPLPQLILIDGGRGQLAAALRARDQAGYVQLPMVGLAKAQEKIIISPAASLPGSSIEAVTKAAATADAYVKTSGEYLELTLPPTAHAVKLLQRIRDESHRFAVSYHTSLRRDRTGSALDELPGIGPVTRKKILRHFGSAKAATQATEAELVDLLGSSRGQRLFGQLQSFRQ